MVGTPLDAAATLAAVEGVEGWMTDAQGRRLHAAAGRVRPGGLIVEIGSFRGRSTTVLALGSDPSVEVVAIDPHGGGDRGPQEYDEDAARGQADNDAFEATLAAAGVRDRVRHVRKRSDQAHGDVDRAIDLLYVDGAHRFAPARDDLRGWGPRVAPGGTLLVHDAFNAIGLTLAMLTLLLVSRDFRYLGRDGSLAEYERVPLQGAAAARNAAAQLAQLPYFLRMVAVKVALTLHAWPLARALGHPTRQWPY